jgi:hypothetical protein
MLADWLARLIGLVSPRCRAALVVGSAPAVDVPLLHQRLLFAACSGQPVHPTTVGDAPSARTGRTRLVVAAIAAAIGLVWLLQGVGALPGSFMSGDIVWAWAGLALIAAAVVYGAWPRLRRR